MFRSLLCGVNVTISSLEGPFLGLGNVIIQVFQVLTRQALSDSISNRKYRKHEEHSQHNQHDRSCLSYRNPTPTSTPDYGIDYTCHVRKWNGN